MNEVYKFINNLNIKSEYIVVAVSGGPDSMFLLKLLQDTLDKKIVVAHVHHNIRKESDEEAYEIEKYCKNNNLIFEMFKIEKYPNDKFSEENARSIRYEFFDKILNKYNSDILFTAHHGDDLIETILMRLMRGTNFLGYAGIRNISCRKSYKIARPLIYLTKSQIQVKIDEIGLWYANDLSNKSNNYKRNRIRNNILPLLKKENKNVHTKFLEFSNKILMIDEYIKKETNNIKNEIIVNNSINICEFNKLDDIIKMYLLEDYLFEIYEENIKMINNTHVSIILSSLDKDSVSISLPCNKVGIVEYNTFKIVNKELNNYYDLLFYDKVVLPDNKIIEIDNNTSDTSNYVIHLNSSDIKFPLHVRCKKAGDKISVKNMNGSKSVSDIFTDEKVLKEKRESYPVVTDDDNNIIWIPGIKKSKFDRKKEGKYDIILRYH